MSKRHEESHHVQTLQRQLAQYEITQPAGLARLFHEFPELRALMRVSRELLEMADARSGASWDESRGNPDPISADGKSTSAGRPTHAARRKVEYWRRRIAGQVEAMQNDLDPMASRNTSDVRPRCSRRKCDGKNRRQPVGVKFCGFCREEMKA